MLTKLQTFLTLIITSCLKRFKQKDVIDMLLCLFQESDVFEITDFTTASDWERSVILDKLIFCVWRQ